MNNIEKFQELHKKMREFEEFVNMRDELHLGIPNAVALRYPMPFDSCHVYVEDEQFIAGVVFLAKRRIVELKRELNELADNII